MLIERSTLRTRLRVAAAGALLVAAAPAAAAPSWARGIVQTPVETVATGTESGDGGNSWGGHQTRVVRTKAGVFTVYTVPGGGYLDRQWRLARRAPSGGWQIVAQGTSGREPPNLLTTPGGDLWLTAWPHGVGTIWRFKVAGGKVSAHSARIPGAPKTDWPYGGAGIDSRGNLCVVASDSGGDSARAWFSLSCRNERPRSWVSRRQDVTYRHAYAVVLPDGNARATVAATRDVLWSTIGRDTPSDSANYAFNAIGSWRGDLSRGLRKIDSAGENPTGGFPAPMLRQLDAYRDTSGRLHVLYIQRGERTRGRDIYRHRAIGGSGKLLYDEQLPEALGDFVRIFQDRRGNFYVIGQNARLARLSPDGRNVVGDLLDLDYGGREVSYSGYALSVPRTGTRPSDRLDVVFATDGGNAWAYFQLRFP